MEWKFYAPIGRTSSNRKFATDAKKTEKNLSMLLVRMEKPDDDEEFDKLDHILEQSGCLKELEESKDCQVDR